MSCSRFVALRRFLVSTSGISSGWRCPSSRRGERSALHTSARITYGKIFMKKNSNHYEKKYFDLNEKQFQSWQQQLQSWWKKIPILMKKTSYLEEKNFQSWGKKVFQTWQLQFQLFRKAFYFLNKKYYHSKSLKYFPKKNVLYFFSLQNFSGDVIITSKVIIILDNQLTEGLSLTWFCMRLQGTPLSTWRENWAPAPALRALFSQGSQQPGGGKYIHKQINE